MLSTNLLAGVKHFRSAVCSRNIGLAAPALQKCSDPIQQLFVDKLREYKQKSDGGSKLVDATPEIEKELKTELEKVMKQFAGAPGEDMTKFPSFQWKDPVIDSIDAPQAPKPEK